MFADHGLIDWISGTSRNGVSVEMTVIPNSPFAIYATPPTRTGGWTEKDWLAALPPLDQSQRQFGVALLLGESRYGQLGDYPTATFADPAVAPALAAFRARLSDIERAIGERNKTRIPYIYMLRLASSISIQMCLAEVSIRFMPKAA